MPPWPPRTTQAIDMAYPIRIFVTAVREHTNRVYCGGLEGDLTRIQSATSKLGVGEGSEMRMVTGQRLDTVLLLAVD